MNFEALLAKKELERRGLLDKGELKLNMGKYYLAHDANEELVTKEAHSQTQKYLFNPTHRL